MKPVAGLVVLLSVGMVYGLTIDVGINSAHFISAPDSPKAPDNPGAPDNPEDPCDFDEEDEEEKYQVHPGIRCLGHDIKPDKKADIKGCEEACNVLPDCVGFVHSDDESRGFCRFKKDSCLTRLKPKPGLSLFVKPGIKVPKL